jgi:hypothetical protein
MPAPAPWSWLYQADNSLEASLLSRPIEDGMKALIRAGRWHCVLHRWLCGLLHLVQIFGFEICVASQHSPIFMACYHSDLWY